MIPKEILLKALRDGEFIFSSEYGTFTLIPERDWKNKLKEVQPN